MLKNTNSNFYAKKQFYAQKITNFTKNYKILKKKSKKNKKIKNLKKY